VLDIVRYLEVVINLVRQTKPEKIEGEYVEVLG
jgi:hypothetical protein